MKSRIGDLIRGERERRGLDLQRMAQLIGYKNLEKGARRIACVERHGKPEGSVRAKLISALGLGAVSSKAIASDRAEQERAFQYWVNTPIEPEMIVRCLPGFYLSRPLPFETRRSSIDMEEFARDFAKVRGCMVCLKLSRRESVWIDSSGRIYSRSEATPDDPVNSPAMVM